MRYFAFPNHFALAQDPTQSQIVGKAATGIVPGIKLRSASINGFEGYTVNKFSTNKELATAWVEFTVSPDVQKIAQMKLQNLLPTAGNPGALTSAIGGLLGGKTGGQQQQQGGIGGILGAITGQQQQQRQQPGQQPKQPVASPQQPPPATARPPPLPPSSAPPPLLPPPW